MQDPNSERGTKTMKQKTVLEQKMRLVAGGVYMALAIYQMFIARTVAMNASLQVATFTWISAMLLIVAAGAMAVWMFSSDKLFGAGTRRAVVVGTVLWIAFELMTYSEQANVINYTLGQILPNLYGQQLWLYFFMVVRYVLMILAAFFVTSCKEALAPAPELEPAKAVEKADAKTTATRKAAASKDLDKPLAATANPAAAGELDKPIAPAAKPAAPAAPVAKKEENS